MYYKYQSINKMLMNQNLPNLFQSLYSPKVSYPLPQIILRFKLSQRIENQQYIMVNDSKISYKAKLSPTIDQEQLQNLQENAIFKITKWTFDLVTKIILVEDMTYIDTDTDELIFKWWKPKHQVLLDEMEEENRKSQKGEDRMQGRKMQQEGGKAPKNGLIVGSAECQVVKDEEEEMQRQLIRDEIEDQMAEAAMFVISNDPKFKIPYMVTKKVQSPVKYGEAFKKFTQENYVNMIRNLNKRRD